MTFRMRGAARGRWRNISGAIRGAIQGANLAHANTEDDWSK